MIDFTEGSQMRTNASGSPKTQKPNIIPKGQMTNQTPCNYRTPYKPQIEYYDEQMVIVNGVQYQRVEEPKPQTLERIITECMIAYNNTVIVELMERILDRVEVEFFPKLGSIEPPLYNDGWEDCLKELKTRLRLK